MLAVVRPGTLLEQWKVLQAAVAAGRIVIMQAANTGLTGGSTPTAPTTTADRAGEHAAHHRCAGDCRGDRWCARQCHPGQAGQTLAPLGARAPLGHRLVVHWRVGAGRHLQQLGRRAGAPRPGYTELAFYARVKDDGTLAGEPPGHRPGRHARRNPDPAANGDYAEADVERDTGRAASDARYAQDVRVDADTPARFNADPSRLFEASGSQAKVCLFAVRLDTFPKEPSTVFYIGQHAR